MAKLVFMGNPCKACSMPTEDSASLQFAERYWNAAAETYEQKFSGTTVGMIRRRVVWQSLERNFHHGQRILELSCGTGIDAVFLARRGVRVLGCDISPRMIELAQQHAAREGPSRPPKFRVMANEHLMELASEPRFDGAFSNFSGLNCVEDLAQVGTTLGELLKPKARFVLCMMGRFVPFEILWFLAQAKPRRAFHRLLEPRTHYASTSGIVVRRPSVTEIERKMQPAFRLLGWKGIGIVVPPSYAEPLASRVPQLMRRLARIDGRIGPLPILRNMADCVLLEFERTGLEGKDHAR
jgi:SAM-dependent methyltransferase